MASHGKSICFENDDRNLAEVKSLTLKIIWGHASAMAEVMTSRIQFLREASSWKIPHLVLHPLKNPSWVHSSASTTDQTGLGENKNIGVMVI